MTTHSVDVWPSLLSEPGADVYRVRINGTLCESVYTAAEVRALVDAQGAPLLSYTGGLYSRVQTYIWDTGTRAAPHPSYAELLRVCVARYRMPGCALRNRARAACAYPAYCDARGLDPREYASAEAYIADSVRDTTLANKTHARKRAREHVALYGAIDERVPA